jgi:PAS domain S-box-containing protein
MLALKSLFRRAVESAPNAMVMSDGQGRIVLVNNQTIKLFGYDQSELLGQSIESLVPERFRKNHSTYRNAFFAHPETRPMGVGRDLFGRRKDGSEFPVEIGLNPIQTEEGFFVLSAIVDISERKRAEETRRASEERFHTVVENLNEGVVISNLDGLLLHWNPAALRMHGFDNSEDWCRRLPEFADLFELSTLEGRVLTMADWPLSRLLRGERFGGYELRVRRLDIDWNRIFSYGGNIVLDSTGKQLAFLTMIDVTESKRATALLRQAHDELERRVAERTAELAAANKELEAFSYSVSHDLRAPLRAIDGFSRILSKDYAAALPGDARSYLDDIRANTLQMSRLVDDLLAFSRLNRQPLNKQRVDPGKLVRQCLDELRTGQEERSVDVRFGELPLCQADPALLKQVWLNLLSNALKYTGKREPATIQVGCDRQHGQDVYFVKDNGVGFDMRYAQKLFGVFQRLHRAEDYEGTGVGLAIVQRIIHRHGGNVWADAQPNQGATFFFTLDAKGPRHD